MQTKKQVRRPPQAARCFSRNRGLATVAEGTKARQTARATARPEKALARYPQTVNFVQAAENEAAIQLTFLKHLLYNKANSMV